jgi:hypothetical protein
MAVSEAFLIVVDDILSMYLLVSPYSCTVIEQLMQTYIYMLSGRLPGYRTIEYSWWNYWKSGNPRPSVIDSVKIRFLRTHCTWRKWASSPFHPENTYDFKNLYVGSTICFCIFQFFEEKIVDPTGKFLKLYLFNLSSRIHDRRARVNVNATHVKKKAVFENPNREAKSHN